MKNIIAIITMVALTSLATTSGMAQSNVEPGRVTNLFKVNVLMPGISYEQKLGLMNTLHLEAYVDALIVSPTFESDIYRFIPTSSFKTEFRTYYNILDRYQKGKYTVNNSGNYFSLFYQGRHSATGDYTIYQLVNQVGVLWGFQRNTPSGFSFDFNFGIVNTFNAKNYDYYSTIQPATNLRLGYWIGRKRK